MIIGTYSGGSASAYEYSTFEELLSQLPDNTANQIDAVNVRNSVYTLWERYQYVLAMASQSASASIYYSSSLPTTQTIGGITVGTTFINATMQTMWYDLLHPYVAPQGNLWADTDAVTKEHTLVDINVDVNWEVIKGSSNITSITFSYGSSVTASNAPTQSGTHQFVAGCLDPSPVFSMTISDGITIVTYECNFYWKNKKYWGTLQDSNRLVATQSYGTSSAFSNDVDFISPAIVSSDWYDGWTQSQTIATDNDYVFFAFPHDTVDFSSNLLHVKIGGMGNNNWIKTRDGAQFTNSYGYNSLYDVWIFGNTQAPNTFVYDIS